MFKWHVNSAIGRGRPAANDCSRVADGIAASLRQFSISLSRSAEENDSPQTTRSQRSAEAVKEISEIASDLAPAPARGVDARSLAAKPPQGLKITRVFEDSKPRGGGLSYRGQGGDGFRGSARGGPGGPRGGMRGRGGSRGGRGAARGRGRGRGGKKAKPPNKEDLEEFVYPPMTAEELAYQAGSEQGFLRPYEPTLTAESLARHGPPVASSPRGVLESIVYKMQVATSLPDAGYDHGENHLLRVGRGPGTLFENDEQRAITQAFSQQKGKERAEKMGVPYEPELNELGKLSEKDKARALKEWVGGQYVFPKPAEVEDALGQVAGYARRNETYLPEGTRKFQEKLKSLLPATKSTGRLDKTPL
ncbi:hypothetical protein N431DRAFT_346725 [Stipitochalara longipes BDJ]|nr:hypothetical protein N431DRAFT_346725 [Stipitochalara longipes BDJ]